jgi:hypothetical protein
MSSIKLNYKQYLWPILTVVGLAGLIYWLTACRSVGYNDSGELAANCFFLSIPHPTGYPLYANLGRLAILLLPGSVIFRCTLLSLALTAIASGALFLVMLLLPVKIQSQSVRITAAGAAALFAAFSPVWWSQGTSNEVYSLTLLLSTLAVLCFLRYSQIRESKYLLIGFYCWGLSFTVHMSSIFLFFAIAYICITVDGWKELFKLKYFWSIAFFILALTFYAYLPIRASSTPFLNWSAAQTFQGFINHLSGWQYRIYMFSSSAMMIDGIKNFGRLLYGQFGVMGILLIVIGISGMLLSKLKLAMYFGLIILVDILLSSNYTIPDIDSYYLPAIMSFTIFMFWGIIVLYSFLEKGITSFIHLKAIAFAVIIILVGLPLSNLMLNYSKQDISHWRLADAGERNILQAVEPNGVAFIESWNFYSPWLYLHYVENLRPDIVFIQKDLLSLSWYLDFLQRNHPDILEGSRNQIKEFKKALSPIESGGKADIRLLTDTHTALINSIIDYNIIRHAVYVDYMAEQTFDFRQRKIPIGGLYKLEDSLRYIPFDINKIDISPWESAGAVHDAQAMEALDSFYGVLKSRAEYCHRFGHSEEAREYANLVSRIEKLFKASVN